MKNIKVITLLALIAVEIICTTSSYAKKSTEKRMPLKGTFVLKGTAQNVPKDQTLFTLAVCDPFENQLHEITFNDDGSFQKEVPIIGTQDIYLYLGDAITYFACVGDTLNLSFDYNDRPASVQLTGTTEARNQELVLEKELYTKYREPLLDIHKSCFDPTVTDSILLNSVNQYIINYRTTIEEYTAQHGPIAHESYLLQRGYFDALSLISRKPDAITVLYNRMNLRCYPDSRQEKMPLYKDPSFNPFLSPSALTFMEGYLNTNITTACQISVENDKAKSLLKKIKIAELAIPDKELCDWFCIKVFNNEVKWGDEQSTDEMKNIGNYLSAKSTTPLASQKLMETMDQIFNKMSKGQPAPDFTLTNEKNEAVSLHSLRGKIVYIDFWSDGCAPCIQEFKLSDALHQKYKAYEDQIAYVYIHLRGDKSRWKELIKQYNLTGINLYAASWNEKGLADYASNFVPMYVMIDAQGKIMEYNTLRPSNLLRDETNLLDKVLKK